MCVPIFQGNGQGNFWLNWMLTGNDYKIYSIIQPISTIAFTVQDIAINDSIGEEKI